MDKLLNLTGIPLFLACFFILLCGICECFAGFKIIKGVITAAGLCAGAAFGWQLGSIIVSQFFISGGITAIIQLGITAASAIIISMLAFRFSLAGMFILYGFSAFILTYAICGIYAFPGALAVIIGIAFGILIGIISVKAFRPFAIISTAAIGGILTGLAVYAFLKNRYGFYANAVPGLIFFIVGIVFQFKTTKNNSDDTGKKRIKQVYDADGTPTQK